MSDKADDGALRVSSITPNGIEVNVYQASGQEAKHQTITADDNLLRFSFLLQGSAQAEVGRRCIAPVLGSGRIGYAPGKPMTFIHSEDFRQLEVVTDVTMFQSLVGDEYSEFSKDIDAGLLTRLSRCSSLNNSARVLAQRFKSGANSLMLYSSALDFIGCHLQGLNDNRQSHSNISDHERRCLLMARDYLLADLSKSPTIPQLSAAIGMNQLKLKKGFKTLFGDSIYAFFQRHRMAKAEKLLQRQSVTETATELGYSNLSHFSSAFKKINGELPGQFRRQLQRTDRGI